MCNQFYDEALKWEEHLFFYGLQEQKEVFIEPLVEILNKTDESHASSCILRSIASSISSRSLARRIELRRKYLEQKQKLIEQKEELMEKQLNNVEHFEDLEEENEIRKTKFLWQSES